MAVQGRGLSETEVQRIVFLLSSTEMTIAEIAERMRCSRSTVISINRRWHVRAYRGSRSKWRTFESESRPNRAERDESVA
jgi:hypothetical protein